MRADEVVPDSQEEADLELLVPESLATVLERDQSPPAEQFTLINAMTSSYQTSSSYVLPQSETIQHAAASTISEFTSETPMTTESIAPSTISAFSSSGTAKKSRPKPRPTFGGASALKDTSTSGIYNAISPSTSLPSVSTTAPAPHVLPPEPTFSADISERIKARRARPASRSMLTEPPEKQEKEGRKAKGKKQTVPVEAVINVSSDEELQPRPPRPSAPSKHPTKLDDAPEFPGPLSLSNTTRLIPSTTLHEVDDVDLSPIPTRKRKRHVVAVSPDPEPSVLCIAVTSGGMDAGGAPQAGGDHDVPPPKKKKKTKKVVDDEAYDDLATGKPKKKKPKAKGPERQKTHAKTKVQEKEHFKSSEFILDSDDELGLKAGDGANGLVTEIEPIASISAAPVVATALPQAPLAVGFSTKPEIEHKADTEVGSEKPTGEASGKKTSSKKRKTVAGTPNEVSANGASASFPVGGNSPSKRSKRLAEGEDPIIIKGREKRNGARANSVSNIDSANDTNGAEQKPDVPEVRAKRKKGTRMIVEDEGEDDAKENFSRLDRRTATSKALEPAAPPLNKLLSKPASIYPPKNRPLSAILQVVNGSSPRPRASPSVSRKLLSRIAPLHPNRRTPPPPPPPRIVPKKTKKELEREEKWEEELQETVEGWCELGDEERNRMRRAKRDWEMGLCE